jgi:Flp pilus assembly secretin CpaC
MPALRPRLSAATLALFVCAVSAAAAQASELIVRYDQSTLLRLPRAVSEVIIGNPSIADVTVQGGNLLVVTGKTFGMTNIIALDAQRNIIQDQRVIVEQDPRRTVSLYLGSERQSYTCAPTCEPTAVIGDSTKHFEAVVKAGQSKSATSSQSLSQQPAAQ